MFAHLDGLTGRGQDLADHSRHVSALCADAVRSVVLTAVATLIGLIHDMGKGTEAFQIYLRVSAGTEEGKASCGQVHHAPIGAVYAFRRWYQEKGELAEKLTAQIVMMTVYAHHAGLMDVITPSGETLLLEKMENPNEHLSIDEAVWNFHSEVADTAELDGLFRDAVIEIRGYLDRLNAAGVKKKAFANGLLIRYLLGVLVDADRWDSACFAYGEDPFRSSSSPDWNNILSLLNIYVSKLPNAGRIGEIRTGISDACERAAELSPYVSDGLYRLSVPTGGGKTFASLRFALRFAALHPERIRRILYIIPFNTILDQNARDIREAVGDSVGILEHHSGVVFDEHASPGEIENYRRLTERWDCDLILTSMVQFLNSFFSSSNTDARRLAHLSGSVLIFDEIQALPKRCTQLFEQAVDFLTAVLHCTIVLCTATQPDLHFHAEPREMIPDTAGLFRELKRTALIDESRAALTFAEAAERVRELVGRYGSVLMIVNTKAAAREMGMLVKESGIPTLHLSTDMVPAHRLEIIDRIRNRDRSEPLFCVSTALIEAGINISFPCVVRSLTGLGSILQAAGRCNRNAELGDGVYGDVYIWSLNEESLKKLPEIEAAQQVTRGLLASAYEPDSPEGIGLYYRNERKDKDFAKLLPYPVTDPADTLFSLLGVNGKSYAEIPETRRSLGTFFPVPAAFRTAEDKFRVIDQDTISVLVPYKRGEEIITALCSLPGMDEKIRLLREAGRYSVSLYEHKFRKLRDELKAVRYLEDSGVYILDKAYYSLDYGVTDTPAAMDYLDL